MPGPSSDELKGLNWHVQVDPLTLSMTSFPPTLPAFAAKLADELLDELPPQAVITRDTVTNSVSHLKRFIDTLRSPLDHRRLLAGPAVCGPHLARAEHLGNT